MKHLIWISIALLAIAVGCKKSDKMSLAMLTTTAASNVTSSGAQMGGNITSNGGSNIAKRGTVFATHPAPTLSDSSTNDGTGSGTFTSSLTNLMANTTYYAKAYAANADGTAYGDELNFTTAKGVPFVTTTAISNNQQLSATTGWTVVNNGGAAITSVGVCWSTSPHPTTTDNKITDSAYTGSATHPDTLKGLNVTTYYIRAFAVNSYGTGYGNEISFTVANSGDIVTDIDGNAYLSVVIGTQTWMTSNLKVTHYNNGDAVVNGLATNFNWQGAINDNANSTNYTVLEGAYTFPNGDSATKEDYGLLYNNFVVDDPRGICPAGWHTPYETEWQNLAAFLGGTAKSDTLYMGVNNGASGNFGSAALAAKLLTGGSSGLNLQLTGGFFIASPNSYKGFLAPGAGYYWGASIAGYPDPSIESFFGGVNNFFVQINTGTDINNSNFQFSNAVACSIRCVKN